ncbi:MAG: phospholipase D-like domain-containing protein [Pseudomonadota bacterium]|nr:phospholipase D-like domain-containing protein [Pseudomonadota bacterium]
MSDDAEVVRCSSPWPGNAAQLLEGFARLGEGAWRTDQICSASRTALASGDAIQILCGLEVASVCTRSEDGNEWSTELDRNELLRLATLLRGAEQFRRIRQQSPQLEFVVTMPMAPSYLAETLPDTPSRPGGYLPTSAAMLRVAQTAAERIVIMSPFVDSFGFGWLRSVFEASHALRKILILRDADRYAVELSVHNAEWLRAQAIEIWDYHLPHTSGTRALPLETFHAKIVLADNCLGYVGSANFIGSGDGTSLEAGVLVDGTAAAQVAKLIDAVIRVARRI